MTVPPLGKFHTNTGTDAHMAPLSLELLEVCLRFFGSLYAEPVHEHCQWCELARSARTCHWEGILIPPLSIFEIWTPAMPNWLTSKFMFGRRLFAAKPMDFGAQAMISRTKFKSICVSKLLDSYFASCFASATPVCPSVSGILLSQVLLRVRPVQGTTPWQYGLHPSKPLPARVASAFHVPTTSDRGMVT